MTARIRRQHIARRLALLLMAAVIPSGTARCQEQLEETELVSSLHSAFQVVVHDARDWTVRILVDEKPAVMGVVVREDGWILTKASPISEGVVTCRLPAGETLDAEQRHVWAEHDLAMLKVDANGLSSVRWAGGDDPAVGQWLATAGQEDVPLGVGIVSVARREIPLVHLSGVLGVSLAEGDGPATVVEVIKDSAAARAQLQSGDVVFRIDDEVIPDRQSMIEFIRQHEPGQKIRLNVKRGEEELDFEVTLSQPFGQFLNGLAQQNHMGGELSLRRSGFPAVIQHDTVLSPEDCGGPVVDLDGRAVGINIARAGRTESYAVPAGVIRPLLKEWFSRGDDPRDPVPSPPPAPPTAVRVDD